jgi:hypothetical protein
MISPFCFIYRTLFCRGGYGIHSPFVFDLITNVIEEKRPFYCYKPLSEKYRDFKKINKGVLPKKVYELYFRLTNKFKPKSIFISGADAVIASDYLTAFSKNVEWFTGETEDIDIKRKFDLIICGNLPQHSVDKLFLCANENTLIILSGINKSSAEKRLWREICQSPNVSVTIDLYQTGLIFCNPKLHRKTYIIQF